MNAELVKGAASEAEGFLQLIRMGGATADQARQQIGTANQFRRAVLRNFDLQYARLSRDRKRLLRKVYSSQVSDRLKKEVERLLRLGWPQSRILRALPVGPGVVLRISKAIGASALKPRGRGRRLSPELIEKIRRRVREGARSVELQKEFQIDYDTTIRFRNEAGDFENRRHWMKLSPKQIAQATEKLRAGEPWRDVARDFNVAIATLMKRVAFRKAGYPDR